MEELEGGAWRSRCTKAHMGATRASQAACEPFLVLSTRLALGERCGHRSEGCGARRYIDTARVQLVYSVDAVVCSRAEFTGASKTLYRGMTFAR